MCLLLQSDLVSTVVDRKDHSSHPFHLTFQSTVTLKILHWFGILKSLFCKLLFPRMIPILSSFFASMIFLRNPRQLWDITLCGLHSVLQAHTSSTINQSIQKTRQNYKCNPGFIIAVTLSFFVDDFTEEGSNNTNSILRWEFKVTKGRINDAKVLEIKSRSVIFLRKAKFVKEANSKKIVDNERFVSFKS